MKKTTHVSTPLLRFLPDWVWISVLYLATHLPSLTLLPVFADEAIYIRWGQLIIDDPQRFLFFSMADGKPPLFMWLLSLVLPWFPDPLFAGRLLSVVVGLVTVFAMRAVAKELTGSKTVQNITGLFTTVLPFWFFHHRMALMDGLLTLCIAASFLFALRISKRVYVSRGMSYQTIRPMLLLSVAFGFALMTKTPALFAIPVITLTPAGAWILTALQTGKHPGKAKILRAFLWTGLAGVGAMLLFVTLRISPFFGALFTRSGDFTFKVSEVLAGEWRYVLLESLPRSMFWLLSYLTAPFFVFILAGATVSRYRRIVVFLIICAILFAAPFVLFGRVLWPRYFLPVSVFLTLAAACGCVSLLRRAQYHVLAVILIVFSFLRAATFIIPSYVDVAAIPFVEADTTQYLTEWSAGFGNQQVRDYIKERAGGSHIVALTEGSFGTLPDGLQMYFFGDNATPGVEIHGIGVAPQTIPKEFLARSQTQEVYYIVNSHRFGLVDTSNLVKVMEIPRPLGGPSLLMFRVSGKEQAL